MIYDMISRVVTEATLQPKTKTMEVGDPTGGVDIETQEKRKQAKSLKADAELISAKAILAKTRSDAKKTMDELRAQKIDAIKAKRQAQMQAKSDDTVHQPQQ